MKTKFSALILLILLAGLGNMPPAAAGTADIAVVVNPGNNTSSLSLGELRKIFNGEKRSWPGGRPVKLLVRGNASPERTALLTLLGMSEGDYKQYWTAQIFKGEAQSEPVALPSNGMQKEALNLYPGAIAMIAMTDVRPGMKVLKIDGRLPGESDYPLGH